MKLLLKEISDRYVQENFKRLQQVIKDLESCCDGSGGGSDGVDGLNGINGTNGNSLLNGSGSPSDVLGVDGDFYLDTDTYELYGPKDSGTWPLPPVELKNTNIEQFTVSRIADEAISALQLVTATSTTNCKLATNDSIYGDAIVLGVAMNSGAIGASITILTAGVLEDPFFMFPIKELIFLGTSGNITSTPPTSPTANFSTTLGESWGDGSIYLDKERPIEL